jgi:hypothetical protein
MHARNPVIELQDEIQLQGTLIQHANQSENVTWTILYIEG